MLSLLTVVVLSQSFSCDVGLERWRSLGLSPPCVVLNVPQAQRVAAAKKAWGLSDEAATCAIEATETRTSRLDARSSSSNPWLVCVERWPGEVALWAGAEEVQLWIPSSGRLDWDAALAGLAKRADAVVVARRLLKLHSPSALVLARLVLARAPEETAAVFETLRSARDTVLALGLPLIEEASLRAAPASCEALATVGQTVLLAALEGDELQLAAETWRQLPQCARDGVSRRGLWTSVVSGLADVTADLDLRDALALALVVDGQLEAARSVARWAAHSGVDAGPGEHPDPQPLVRAVLALQLEGRRMVDPWEAAVLFRQRRFPAEALGVLLPLLAPNEDFARTQLAWALKDRARAAPRDEDPALAARRGEARQRAQARLRSLPMRGAPEVADAGPVRSVNAPSVFVERKTAWKGSAVRVAPSEVQGLPEGFYPVRAEKTGRRTVVLATSRRVDPAGEVSMAGLWLLLSTRAPGGWETLYLGLREHHPFRAQTLSAVPLLEGDVVRLDVDEAPLDEQTVTFPPMRTRTRVVRTHVVLETSLAALRRDTDGDGVPDLLEARLLLDPTKKDTDGDGLSDRDDPTPRLDDRLPVTPRAEVLNAFLELMAGEEARPAALVVVPAGAPAKRAVSTGVFVRGVLDDVQYLVGTPGELAGLRPLRCLITLSPAEYAAAQAAFGLFFPMSLEVHVSPDGQRAWIDWSEDWRGGSVSGVRDAQGRWVLTEETTWIT